MNAEDVADIPIFARSPVWTLHREPQMQLLRLHGEIDDAASDAWRAAAKKNFDDEGWPRVAFVAPSNGTATSSLAARVRTAKFLKLTASNVQVVAIVVDTQRLFVIRTILRAAGVNNVELVDLSVAKQRLAELRRL